MIRYPLILAYAVENGALVILLWQATYAKAMMDGTTKGPENKYALARTANQTVPGDIPRAGMRRSGVRFDRNSFVFWLHANPNCLLNYKYFSLIRGFEASLRRDNLYLDLRPRKSPRTHFPYPTPSQTPTEHPNPKKVRMKSQHQNAAGPPSPSAIRREPLILL